MKEPRLSNLQRLPISIEEIKIEEDESFNEFYAKLKDIVNSTFNLRETILEPKIVRKVLRSLFERFHAKITTIGELKDIDKIPLTKLVGNLQIYKLGLTRIGKSNKSKMKSYITWQFKKVMKNANAKSFNKDRRQSNSSQSKSQDKGKKDARDSGQYTIPSGPKCFRCQGFEKARHLLLP